MNYTRFIERWSMSLFIVGIVIGVPVGAYLWPSKEIVVREGTPDNPAAISSVNLMVNYGNGTIKTWNTITHHESMSVLDLLQKVHAANNIVLTTGPDESGAIKVRSIDEISEDPDKGLGWHYWVNNTREPRIAGKYYLKPGDIVVWALSMDE
jgi:hypothetical protein